MFQLAEHLHKSLEEVQQLSVSEVNGWSAYFALKNDEAQKKRQ